MNQRVFKYLVFFVVLISILGSCAPEENTYETYGFLSGIWHGFCFPFALIGKIFGMDVGLYARNNSGFFYWIGFLIGLGILGGGASRR